MKVKGKSCWLPQRAKHLKWLKWWQQRKVGSAGLTSSWLQQSKATMAMATATTTTVKSKPMQMHLFKAKGNLVQVMNHKSNMPCTDSFHEAIRPVLILAQVFALMPVCGITATTANALNFSWTCARTFYALLIIVCFGVSSGYGIAYTFTVTFSFDSVETLIFYTSIFLIAIAFFVLARKWPALLLQWQDVESTLPRLYVSTTHARRCPRRTTTLAFRIKLITVIATLCSLVEHSLSMAGIVYFVQNCPALPNRPIDSFLYTNFSEFFHFVAYSTPVAIFGKVLNLLSTFAWNFNDVFVMSVSVALSARFRQLNDYMEHAVQWPTDETFWIRNRVNYRNLCKLCAAVDNAISTITLLCFSNNLYFICGKILKSVRKKPSVAHMLYFWYSLFYLLARTFILSLFAAEINDESKRPLQIFRRVQRDSWCPELKRFSEEVTTDVVALSGMKFFQITRSVVLSVAGTIVTYELVLLQFNKEEGHANCHKS